MSKSTLQIMEPLAKDCVSEYRIIELNTDQTLAGLIEKLMFADLDASCEFHMIDNSGQYACSRMVGQSSIIMYWDTYKNDAQVIRNHLRYRGYLDYAKYLAHKEHHSLHGGLVEIIDRRILENGRRNGFLASFNDIPSFNNF